MDDAFPTLQLVLEKVDPNCGFNIEVKWDMLLKDGSNECHAPFEINSFIDAILSIVHKSKKSKYRKIVFSSFSPDVCSVMDKYKNKREGPVEPVFSTKIQEKLDKKARSPKSWCSCQEMNSDSDQTTEEEGAVRKTKKPQHPTLTRDGNPRNIGALPREKMTEMRERKKIGS